LFNTLSQNKTRNEIKLQIEPFFIPLWMFTPCHDKMASLLKVKTLQFFFKIENMYGPQNDRGWE